MKKSMLISLIVLFFSLLLIPSVRVQAEESVPEHQPLLSHVCDKHNEGEIKGHVVWPAAPAAAENSVGELHFVDSAGVKTEVSLIWDRFTGPTAHWDSAPITATAPYTVTHGWVVDQSTEIGNLPQSIDASGQWQCAPTAVTLQSVSAQQAASGDSIFLGGNRNRFVALSNHKRTRPQEKKATGVGSTQSNYVVKKNQVNPGFFAFSSE